jgi:4-hydroxy-2-oxoheptanedioate aldolase
VRRSKILAKIRAGRVARLCCIGSPLGMAPAIAAHYGYDGIWVDAEHRVWDPRETEAMIGRHHAADIDCLWRPPTKEKTALYRLLEDGATGLMIPHVSTAEQAAALVQAVKFPPLGDRGFDGAGRDAGFWFGAPSDYLAQANRETFLVVQIETQEALNNVEAIAAVPGVEILFIGPGDLSLRLGCTPGVSDRLMLEAQQRVAAAARRHGKAWGRPVGGVQDARVIVELGAQLVAMGSEFGALCQHFAGCSAEFDELLGEKADATASSSPAVAEKLD